MVASYRYVGAPVRQENHLPEVASRSLTLFESISLIRPGSRAEATQIVDSWNRPVVSEVSWGTSSLSPLERWLDLAVTDGHVCVVYILPRLTKLCQQRRTLLRTTWNM